MKRAALWTVIGTTLLGARAADDPRLSLLGRLVRDESPKAVSYTHLTLPTNREV